MISVEFNFDLQTRRLRDVTAECQHGVPIVRILAEWAECTMSWPIIEGSSIAPRSTPNLDFAVVLTSPMQYDFTGSSPSF